MVSKNENTLKSMKEYLVPQDIYFLYHVQQFVSEFIEYRCINQGP